MKKNGISHIRKWLTIFLALILLTTIGLHLLIYLEVTGTMSAFSSAGGTVVKEGIEVSASTLLAGFEQRLLIILGSGFVVCTILGLIWVNIATRRINQPVHTISTAMSKLAKGQLNETVVVETSDELEQIGSYINELAANLQELLLYIWKQSGQCHTLLDQIRRDPDFSPDKHLTAQSIGHLEQLSAAIDDLREMAKAYVFYDVSIDGTNTQAISELGEGASSTEITRQYN